MNHCNYQMPVPNLEQDKNKILCGAYSKSKRKDKLHWAHYPHCKKENCPLVHKDLLQGATLERS